MTGLLMLAAGTALAGWEGSLTPYLFTTSFGTYATGEALSDKGATNGTWVARGAVASHAHTAAETNGLAVMCMAIASDSHGVPFTVKDEGKGLTGPKNVHVRLSPGSVARLPAFQQGTVKASFLVYLPWGESDPSFQGWSADGWKTLSAQGVTASTNAWYDVSMWLVKTFQNKIQVQYRLKGSEGDYVALNDETGATWFDAGAQDDAVEVSNVTLRGAGTFERITGKELPSPGVSVSFQ